MTQATAQENWVLMEVAPEGHVAYLSGAIDKISSKAEAPRQSRLRVMYQSNQLTKQAIVRLEQMALKFLHQGNNALSFHEAGVASRKSFQHYYFSYEHNGHIKLVKPRVQKGVKQFYEPLSAAAEIYRNRFAHGVEGVVELTRAGADESFDETWFELRRSLDEAMGYSNPSEHYDSIKKNLDPDGRRKMLLARNWPTSEQVGHMAGSRSSNKGQWARDKRAANQLLGVWSAEERGFRHPDFQFEKGELIREVAELLSVLAGNPAWAPASDANGWRRAYWLYQPRRSLSKGVLEFAKARSTNIEDPLHGSPDEAAAYIQSWLNGPSAEQAEPRTPAAIFSKDPAAVIALARRDVEKAAGPDSQTQAA